MLDRQALEYLVELGEVKIMDINGLQYSTDKLYHVAQPSPAALKTTTLTALVDYIKSGMDDKFSKLLVHVQTPTKVSLYSELRQDADRECYMICEALTPNNICFDKFIETDRFNIMLQSSFVNMPITVNDETIDYKNVLLLISGRIKESEVKEFGDDGVSQSAVVRTGVASVNEVKVPNPVILAPYRTFPEVVQPESKFIFRMESGPKAALFEADGGAWRNEAMERIKCYLASELKEFEDIKIIS